MVLEQLVLSLNLFDGKIPDELLSYENLTSIDLRANHLSKSIPFNIGKLSKLETLILSSNNLIELVDFQLKFDVPILTYSENNRLNSYTQEDLIIVTVKFEIRKFKSFNSQSMS
ncbi:LRR receptor serine/threonine-protein kinase EFR [Spatholobus suberectus]|nr:LRR receptor serine/threonine-protein kinase EFR [Spatholobus suberectus]